MHNRGSTEERSTLADNDFVDIHAVRLEMTGTSYERGWMNGELVWRRGVLCATRARTPRRPSGGRRIPASHPENNQLQLSSLRGHEHMMSAQGGGEGVPQKQMQYGSFVREVA